LKGEESVGIRSLNILLIEDDPGDVELMREALQDTKLLLNLHVTGDGVEALAYLRREGVHADAPVPDLILLDLNLPKKDGHQVLKELKSDHKLKMLPVVVVATSSAEEDIVSCYTLGANCVVTKPVGLDEFIRLVHGISEFWLTIVRLPTRTDEMR
jgi:two-component system response regulator